MYSRFLHPDYIKQKKLELIPRDSFNSISNHQTRHVGILNCYLCPNNDRVIMPKVTQPLHHAARAVFSKRLSVIKY